MEEMFLGRITSLLSENHIPYALVGGYAVAIHGVVRGTFDVDIITELSLENFMNIERVLTRAGMKSIIPINAQDLFSNLEKYVQEKNLIAWNFQHKERGRESLDILVTEDIKKHNFILVETGIGIIPVLDINSLIQLKKKAGREQDLADIQALLHIHRKNE